MSHVDFDTPEQAALAAWRGPAGVSVRVRPLRFEAFVEVILDLYKPGHRDFVYCVQRNGRWVEAV